MPLYMDRHDAPETITPEMIAAMHAADLKIQNKYNCRAITYWFDNTRKSAFCLIDAPNKQSLKNMHNAAHGDVPHKIIKVDPQVVETFLGRIEDPQSTIDNNDPIEDSAFRTIMVIELDRTSLKKPKTPKVKTSLENYSKFIVKTIKQHKGRIVTQNLEYFLISFESASRGVTCALKIQSKFSEFIRQAAAVGINLKISLSGDSPVTDNKNFFESAIKLAERMCHVDKASIIVSSEVNDLFISESFKVVKNTSLLYPITPEDEFFLNQLMNYMDESWRDTSLNVEDFNQQLGLSKSQLYRKIISLMGKSPNNFLKDYRLNNALKMLNKQKGNISEIAFDTGFNSPSYFSKCFLKKYGVSPSDYLQLVAA